MEQENYTCFIKKAVLILGMFMFIFIGNITAQKLKNAGTRHYVGGWLFGGYSALFHNFDETSVLGGGGGGLGIGYQLKVKNFLFNTGAEFEFINSTTNINNVSGEKRIFDTQGKGGSGTGTGEWVKLFYDYKRNRDVQNVGIVNVPLLAGMQFQGSQTYYFLLGGKVGLPMMGFNYNRGTVMTKGYYEEYIDTFDNMSNHYYGKQTFKSRKGVSKFSMVNAMISAEVGIELNDFLTFLPKTGKEYKKGVSKIKGENVYSISDAFRRDPPRVRVAIFADYGLLNINANDIGVNANYEPTGFGENEKVWFLWSDESGKIPAERGVPINLLASGRAFDDKGLHKPVKPFIVGIKGTVFFDVTPQPKRDSIPPEIKPVLPPPPVLKITGKIVDVETSKEINGAKIQMFDLNNKDKVVYSETPQYGVFNTNVPRKGNYKVDITAPNYYAYSERFANVGDTLMVYMQPIKKGDVFVLKNIYFEFDKDIITPESNEELDKLSTFLMDNNEVHILITGHTDAKGSDEYNMRLSDRRAKAVLEALIQRGIAKERLTAEGRGKTQPRCPENDTEDCRAENRRIEFEIM
jgi:outer membrane protein OmpA-like peptidoglycan-associated protein